MGRPPTLETNSMNIFQKLFRGGPKNAAERWDVVLLKCDLLMARDKIANMHEMANSQAEKEHGEYYFAKEYVAAWEAFRENPTIDTARTLLDAGERA